MGPAETRLALESFLKDLVEKSGVPGIAVALSVDGQRVDAAYGRVDVDRPDAMTVHARFQIGCLGKLLSALVVLELCSRKELQLDDRVSACIHELPESLAHLTVRHLLSHTGGYRGLNLASPEAAYACTWPRFLQHLRANPPLFGAGEVFSYEHSAAVLLGEVVRRKTARSLEDLVRTWIFEPLEIEAVRPGANAGSLPSLSSHHARHADAGAYVSVRNVPYCDFWAPSLPNLALSTAELVSIASLCSGSRRSGISANALRLAGSHAIRLPAAIGETGKEVLPSYYGHGVAEYANGLWGHNGSSRGQTCAIRFHAQRRFCMAVALNAWEPRIRDLLIDRIAASFGFAASTPAEKLPHHDLDDAVGEYIGPDQTQAKVSRSGEGFKVEFTSRQQSFQVEVDAVAGQMRARASIPHLSFGFFGNGRGADRGLMFGLVALKKVAGAPEVRSNHH